jgi:hypothetical protein
MEQETLSLDEIIAAFEDNRIFDREATKLIRQRMEALAADRELQSAIIERTTGEN